MVVTKESLRREFINKRKKISARERTDSSDVIAQALLQIPVVEKASVICSYISLPDEIDTKSLIVMLKKLHKAIVAPHITGGKMTLREVVSLNDLNAGMFGVLQPRDTGLIIPVESVDVFIVPGVAFDRAGHRLGWGKGYYDKLLQNVKAPRVGLAYSFQVVAAVPHTSYDVPMTHIVTEKEVIIC